MKTAFLGLGVMGFPMAGHLKKGGHEVTVYNRTQAKAQKWVETHGGKAAATPASPATLNPSPSQISATSVNPPSSKANTGPPLSAAPARDSRAPAAGAAITRRQGSIVVVSRPPGAVVALDGRVVGQTPMSIPNVTEGMHVLGIELPGFSRWATAVRVEAGQPTRVGASLTP